MEAFHRLTVPLFASLALCVTASLPGRASIGLSPSGKGAESRKSASQTKSRRSGAPGGTRSAQAEASQPASQPASSRISGPIEGMDRKTPSGVAQSLCHHHHLLSWYEAALRREQQAAEGRAIASIPPDREAEVEQAGELQSMEKLSQAIAWRKEAIELLRSRYRDLSNGGEWDPESCGFVDR